MNKSSLGKLGMTSLILILLLCILPVAASAHTAYSDIKSGPDYRTRTKYVTTYNGSTLSRKNQRVINTVINYTAASRNETCKTSTTHSWKWDLGDGVKKDWLDYSMDSPSSYTVNMSVPAHSKVDFYNSEVTVVDKWTTEKIPQIQRGSTDAPWESNGNSTKVTTTLTHIFTDLSYKVETLPHEADTSKKYTQSDGTYVYHCKFGGCTTLIPVAGAHTCSYAGATCTVKSRCTICGKYGKALGHKWQNATCTMPKKCTRCGTTSGNPKGHSFAPATCTKAKTCKVCGAVSSTPLGHSWGSWTLVETPSATNPGKLKHVCSRCGAVGYKSIR